MAIFETFSKRQKKKELPKTDIYKYDDLPREFRIQVLHIWKAAIGNYHSYGSPSNKFWEWLDKTLARELGLFALGADYHDFQKRCELFLLSTDVDKALDLIELSFKLINAPIRKMSQYDMQSAAITQIPDDAITELNGRFDEHGLGYQFENNEIKRIDSKYLHKEVIKPTLSLLHDVKFQGALEEFEKAHEHLRHKRYKEAISEALKAFESTLKSICDDRQWKYPSNATAKGLIDLVFEKGLIPLEFQSEFAALRGLLESGLPPIRNKQAGHGQGKVVVDVPSYVASYAIHLAATNILLLINVHREKK